MSQFCLTKAYENLFKELSKRDIYRTYSVAEFYYDQQAEADLNKINVVLRIDVDGGFHLCVPLAKELKRYGLHATFYFLTHPERYYKLWGSGIPEQVAALGFEVGLHTDHYYEQLTQGHDGLAKLKADIQKLSQEAGTKIRGMVYHGHPAIGALRTTNWELTKNISSDQLGLDYHDGLLSCYIEPGSKSWTPKCDLRISDFMGYPWSWGWNYYPEYPIQQLQRAKLGDLVHIAFHTPNPYEYWRHWDYSYNEQPWSKDSALSFYRKAALIQLRYRWLGGHTLKGLLFIGMKKFGKPIVKLLSIVLAKGIGRLWPTPSEPEPNTSWETGRKHIYDLGIPFWHHQLEILGMTAPSQGRVLEIGSGNGQWLIAYAEDAEEVIGIEPWEPIRNYSLERIAEYPIEAQKIKVLGGQAEGLPFPDDYFDRILCAEVFMFTEQDTALQEISRVLKPDGKLCLTVNGLGYFMMYILNGLRYKSTQKMSYGLIGTLATLIKWGVGREVPVVKAVNHNQVKRWLAKYDLTLEDTRIYLPHHLYPWEHLGFPTNYAFLARKNTK